MILLFLEKKFVPERVSVCQMMFHSFVFINISCRRRFNDYLHHFGGLSGICQSVNTFFVDTLHFYRKWTHFFNCLIKSRSHRHPTVSGSQLLLFLEKVVWASDWNPPGSFGVKPASRFKFPSRPSTLSADSDPAERAAEADGSEEVKETSAKTRNSSLI